MPATIRDVAKQAGVSIKTVSRVINNEDTVREETRARVVQAIEELGYVANVFAQRLARGRSYTIALVYHNASWHYINHVLRGVLETARQAGYSLTLHPCEAIRNHDCQAILDLAGQRSVDGFIFTPPSDNVSSLLQDLQAADVPVVRITPSNRELPLPYVTATDRQGAYEMGCYLLANGHRRIGFIKGPPEQKAAHDRLAGHQAALAATGVELDPLLVVQGDDHFEAGYMGGLALLRAGSQPTAIVANNDEMAAGVLAAAHQLRIAVPQQLSVAGFDDIPLSRQVWPALTTVRQPIYEMAELATNLLIQILAGETPDRLQYELATELVIRDSTGKVGPAAAASQR